MRLSAVLVKRGLAASVVLLLAFSLFSVFSYVAKAQTGTVLADFVPGGATGNGRGMAFDGTNLYYTITGNPNIYKVTTTGTLLATIPVAGGVSFGGPLAWDGSALWTMNYGTGFTLFRVNPAGGSILSSCNIATQNPTHPAVTSSPRNIGEFPDGLDWTGSSLWVSSEIFTGNWVVEVDTSCNILSAFNPPANLGTGAGSIGGTSGVAFDGVNLWHPTPTNFVTDMLIFQTDTSGATTTLSFVADRLTEDLAFDDVTFAPKCALWGNEATGGPNHLTAYEIPCPVIQVNIDIKPGSFPNAIKLSNKGVIPVAILTTPAFDATTVNPSTVCFGDAEDPTQRDCTEAHTTGHIADVDGDGDLDLMLHYETSQTGIDVGDTTACLTGTTFGGQPIQGCDSVRVIP